MHLSPLFDIYDRTYFDAVIQTAPKKDEPGALVEMVKRHRFNRRTIIVLDRGYEGCNLSSYDNFRFSAIPLSSRAPRVLKSLWPL